MKVGDKVRFCEGGKTEYEIKAIDGPHVWLADGENRFTERLRILELVPQRPITVGDTVAAKRSGVKFEVIGVHFELLWLFRNQCHGTYEAKDFERVKP